MSLSKKMMRGSAWMFGMNWALRLIGIVNTMILARLLAPEDFGLFTMAVVFMGMLTAFSEMGIQLIVIREQNPEPHYYDTAWTMSFIQQTLVALIMLAGAPAVADYFKDPRVADVVRFMSLIAFITAFRNIGVVLMQKELMFRRFFEYRVYTRISRFVIAVPIAYMLRSYWALAISMTIGALIEVFYSYRMHPYRPRFSLRGWRAFTSFAFYITGIRIVQYFNKRTDIMILGRLADSAQLGLYNMSIQVSRMVTSDFIGTVNQALFPGYAKLAGEPDKLGPAYLGSIGAVTALLVPLGIGLSAVAADFVRVVLGSQWDTTVPLVQWLALLAVGEGLLEVVGNQILIVIHRESTNLKLAGFRLAAVVAGVGYAAYTWGTGAIAAAVTIISWCMVPVFFGVVSRALNLHYVELLKVIWRPALASLSLYAAIRALPLDGWPVLLRLAAHILVGAAAYAVVLIGAWRASGSPPGTEQVVLELLGRKSARLLQRIKGGRQP